MKQIDNLRIYIGPAVFTGKDGSMDLHTGKFYNIEVYVTDILINSVPSSIMCIVQGCKKPTRIAYQSLAPFLKNWEIYSQLTNSKADGLSEIDIITNSNSKDSGLSERDIREDERRKIMDKLNSSNGIKNFHITDMGDIYKVEITVFKNIKASIDKCINLTEELKKINTMKNNTFGHF